MTLPYWRILSPRNQFSEANRVEKTHQCKPVRKWGEISLALGHTVFFPCPYSVLTGLAIWYIVGDSY